MKEYIERSVLDRMLTIAAANDSDKNRLTWASAIGVLHDCPSADVVEVQRGTWEKTNIDGFLRCSVCHDCYIDDNWLDGKHWNFCPHCGADL